MAYADQEMSGNRLTALIIVALIHIAVGYLLVTGLAYQGYQQVIKHMTTVDVKEPEKKPPPPPPPPKNLPPPPPPPVVVPQPEVHINPAPPVPTPPPAPTVNLAPPAPPAPPPPAPPKFTAKGPVPRGNPGDWVGTDDYPAAAEREKRAGVTGIAVTIGVDGRVTGCSVTSSSGSADLDEAACKYFSRRGKFTPATDEEGKPTAGHYSTRIKWQLPSDE